ncbi:Rieske 2Fe-2S domain-containing protein [bacterium]|nr:Rieske 2Fe-2S domain-containing protein [bacterium]NCT21545.1 Rieske 2Fe-2S domain-containing protein [bacterium]
MNKINIGKIHEFQMGKVRIVRAGGTAIVVNRTETGFCAVENHCPHLGAAHWLRKN